MHRWLLYREAVAQHIHAMPDLPALSPGGDKPLQAPNVGAIISAQEEEEEEEGRKGGGGGGGCRARNEVTRTVTWLSGSEVGPTLRHATMGAKCGSCIIERLQRSRIAWAKAFGFSCAGLCPTFSNNRRS